MHYLTLIILSVIEYGFWLQALPKAQLEVIAYQVNRAILSFKETNEQRLWYQSNFTMQRVIKCSKSRHLSRHYMYLKKQNNSRQLYDFKKPLLGIKRVRECMTRASMIVERCMSVNGIRKKWWYIIDNLELDFSWVIASLVQRDVEYCSEWDLNDKNEVVVRLWFV